MIPISERTRDAVIKRASDKIGIPLKYDCVGVSTIFEVIVAKDDKNRRYALVCHFDDDEPWRASVSGVYRQARKAQSLSKWLQHSSLFFSGSVQVGKWGYGECDYIFTKSEFEEFMTMRHGEDWLKKGYAYPSCLRVSTTHSSKDKCKESF